MSGIAGMITLEKQARIETEHFQRFVSCLKINACSQIAVKRLHDGAVVGVGELEGLPIKKYASLENTKQLFIWGEIFISKEMNRIHEDNVESLFSLWEKDVDIMKSIHGHFVMVMIDRQRGKYLVFNSCFGMMPVYYAISNQCLYFSSRLQSFIDAAPFSLQLEKCSLLQYLVFNYPINNNSLIKGVNILPAASRITNEKDRWVVEKYDNHAWLFDRPVYDHQNGKEAIDNALRNTVQKYADIQKPFGCAITGGFDSRLILSYLRNENLQDYFLFTYGKNTHADMKVGANLARRFSIPHLPISMDDEFIENYRSLAEESILLSDGTRASNRGHYILMAKMIAEKANIIISGNCGSNILKIVQSPCPVFNRYVLELFRSSGHLEELAAGVYENYFINNPWIIAFVTKEEFVASILQSEIIRTESLKLGGKFYHFLLTNIEKKYFGSEAASYASYCYNYSPFVDSSVMKAIVQTPFYGGHYPFLEHSTRIRSKLVELYAEIMISNDKRMAKYLTSRGFPASWVHSPQGRIAAYLFNKTKNLLKIKKDGDPFNHRKGTMSIFQMWKMNPDFFQEPEERTYSDEIVKAFSVSYWLERSNLLQRSKCKRT